ncbi:sister chromatid cohesion protein PDS5 homolog B-like [Haliotis cracherodii]|uniref:sister chromatid cohesion protein PDS5 homolog B-like n=1 Tax=Haliotis cracherodii TaxID=6455 RepID=UPI0039EBD2AA
MAKALNKTVKVCYPPGCKEVSEEIPKDELIRRLKLLARAFQDMGQDDNDQYAGLALMLATDFYLDHQNKDVRLLVACCIADVFRIFAPEAPYKDQDHLKEIFLFLIKQLRGLEDPEAPSFKRYFYLLENLAWVKSFNICIELDDNQEIFCSLFKLMFSTVSDKHSSKVKNFMLDMMTPLIAEADTVSQELLDVVLINIVEPQKSQNKHAYALAKDLLRRTSNAIEPYIQAFFNNTLMLGKTSESEVSDHLYDLIYELNQVSPNVLLAVLPQLEFKLKSNEEHERKHVTKLLAKMFSEPGSDLANQNKPLWYCFLGRFNDISTSVRIICCSFAQYFVLNHPELTKDILEQLKVRQHDPEETVRIEVINCVMNVAKKDFDFVNEEMMTFIKERTLDKKFKIRREGLLGLGTMYKQVMTKETINPQHEKKVAWIKNKVFHAYYQNSNDDRLLVERIFNINLVPYMLPADVRMLRLLRLYCTLDDHAVKAFNELLKHRSSVRVQVMQLLEAIELHGQPNAPPLFPRLAGLVRTLPEQQKPQEYLKKFSQKLRDDKRMRHLLKVVVHPECSCKKAEEAVKEILKKIGCNPGQANYMYNLVKSLLERIAPVMIDAVAMEKLVNHVNETLTGLGENMEGIHNAGEKSVKLLLALSYAYPHHFRTAEVFEKFLTFLNHDDDTVSDITQQIITNTGSNLQRMHPDIYSSLVPVLVRTAKMGNPKQTKHAIRCISVVCKNKEPILAQVFEYVKRNLDPESANYITSIVALGHIAKLCPEEFATDMKSIVSRIIVKDLLMQDRTDSVEATESWYSDHLVAEETQAKVQAMKLLVRWLQGLKSNQNNSGTSTLRLLYTVIIHEGDLMEHGRINKPELARLRLQAGCCMLKLAEETCYSDIIPCEQFQALALLINDSCYHVRVKFAIKLHKGLLNMRLPLEFMSIFSLAANDPLKERQRQLKQFLNVNIQKRRDYLKQNPAARNRMFAILPDYILPYTVHLLAHDPDFKTFQQTDALKNIKDCLWFVMDPLTGRSEDYNYAFFRRMIENMKQTKDAQCPDDDDMNKKLYAVCDVALGLMNTKTTNITLKDNNTEPVLPAKLFTKPDKSYTNTKSYLPKDFNFDGPRRKGVQALIDGPPRSGYGSKPDPTTTEIIVESPGPVVNPHPKVPRTKRGPLRKKKEEEPGKENDGDSNESDSLEKNCGDSDKSSSPEVAKKSTRSSSQDKNSDESQSSSEHTSRGGRGVKAGTKQTRLEDFKVKLSPAKRGKDSVKKSLVNGTNKRTAKAGEGDGSESAKHSRKRHGSSEEDVPSKRTRGATSEDVESQRNTRAADTKKSKGTKDKNGGGKSYNCDVSETDSVSKEGSVSTPGASPRKRRASSPPPQPSAQVKRSRLTRSNIKTTDSDQEIVPSPTPSAEPQKTLQTKKQETLVKKTNVRNVRRAKAMSNGTSDGEDTAETDSPSSPPRRVAALTRAVQSVGAGEDAEGGVRRKTRSRKK